MNTFRKFCINWQGIRRNFPNVCKNSKRRKKPSLKFPVVYLQKMAEIVHFIDPNNSQLVRRRFQHFHFMFIFLLEHFMMLTILHAKTVTCSMSWQFLSVNIFYRRFLFGAVTVKYHINVLLVPYITLHLSNIRSFFHALFYECFLCQMCKSVRTPFVKTDFSSFFLFHIKRI